METGCVVNDRWIVEDLLGEGNFGWVYSVSDLCQSKERLVIKVHKCKREDSPVADLQNEIDLLTDVGAANANANIPVPKLWDFGLLETQPPLPFMLLERLGEGLDQILKRHGGVLAADRALDFGRQMVDALEFLHRHGWVHRDVKPNNLAVGLHQRHRLYIFDFGRAHKFLDQNYEWKAPRAKCDYGGPLWYASLRGHRKEEQAPHDDLQSVIYLVAQLCKGYLPWIHVPSVPVVHWLKQITPITVVYARTPQGLQRLQYYVNSLRYGYWPDYELFRREMQICSCERN